jgi:DNA polymerase
MAFCHDHMVGVPDMRKRTLELLLATDGEAMPGVVRQVIQTRLEAAKTSTAKLKAMLARVCADGRLRGSLLYYGASTGRYSSVGVQLQNLPRPTMSHGDCCYAVEMIRTKDRTDLEFWYGSTLQVVSDCLRSFIIPDPGHDFAVIDLAKIEAIINAWCAGQDDLLHAFKEGRDTYAEMASRVYRRPITKADKIERQLGKVLILGAGYGLGSVGFWMQCLLGGIPITKELAREAISTYRSENDRIVKHWYAQERAAIEAVCNPGIRFSCGRVEWLMRGGVLFCRLPSGRALSYPYAVIRDKPDRHKRLRPRLHYRAIDPETHQWGEIDTHGAATVENIVQAIARDVLTHIMTLAEDEGVTNVLSVHDEIVAESRHAGRDLGILRDIACDVPWWAPGLPVSVDAGVMSRYGKLS